MAEFNKFRSCCYKQCNAQFAHRVYCMNKEADEHRSPYFVALKNDLKAGVQFLVCADSAIDSQNMHVTNLNKGVLMLTVNLANGIKK